MNRVVKWCALLWLLVAATALADWTPVAEGVDYQRYQTEGIDVHVARVDLTHPELRIVSTRESERGLRVSDYAVKTKALVAINADYFTKEMQPIGLTIGPCGVWKEAKDTEREGVVAVGEGRVEIYAQKDVLAEPEEWMTTAVSGWPLIVRNCEPLTAAQLPGSDAFTRAPHPRTAVGISEDGQMMFLVVADGRREGVSGMTLAGLARFVTEELGACAAMNLDGGGSSAMWITDEIVNRPSDGNERRVANHLAVVHASDYNGCEVVEPVGNAARK